jgi:hypothetical protein
MGHYGTRQMYEPLIEEKAEQVIAGTCPVTLLKIYSITLSIFY